MRLFVAAILIPLPSTAWEATVGSVCTLTHETADARVELIYDPAQPLYSITVTRREDPWAPAQFFGMTFSGERPNTISTSRHVLADDGASLTVTDRGFGNVLDGLQFNESAIAFTASGQSVPLSLDGAAPEVEIFRTCADAGLV